MASFTTSSNGRELSIASSFVKQYYTLLNKAPCFIHNFYSHDSTFIYDEPCTEPVVGREKIKKKMEDLKFNDCRAKIKQIDCLETLAGGLVIQVIGELSNNGKPMRRFLQTFVLAPSPDETRQDGDSTRTSDAASSGGESSSKPKFFVLNSIFRYQDEESETEDEASGIHASTPEKVDSNGTGEIDEKNDVHEPTPEVQPQQQAAGVPGNSQPKTWANMVRNAHPPSVEQQHVTPQQQSQQQNNRRRMMRKPSNKPGRSTKNRPRPPAAGKE